MSSHIIARLTKPAIAAAAVAAACLATVAVPCVGAATAHGPAGVTVLAGAPNPPLPPDNSQWT